LILPVPVILNLFIAPLWDFILLPIEKTAFLSDPQFRFPPFRLTAAYLIKTAPQPDSITANASAAL
jgi:hypothetical protein